MSESSVGTGGEEKEVEPPVGTPAGLPAAVGLQQDATIADNGDEQPPEQSGREAADESHNSATAGDARKDDATVAENDGEQPSEQSGRNAADESHNSATTGEARKDDATVAENDDEQPSEQSGCDGGDTSEERTQDTKMEMGAEVCDG